MVSSRRLAEISLRKHAEKLMRARKAFDREWKVLKLHEKELKQIAHTNHNIKAHGMHNSNPCVFIL